ncbi:MAG: ATP-binding protein [Desulfovibrionaceae bacterium]|nr:ATP-binding protein [Desulfovibrionaceae bacterium]
MAMRLKAFAAITLVVFAVTAANFFTSLSFTSRGLTDALTQDMAFAVEITEGLLSNKIQLIKSSAATMAAHLLRTGSNEALSDSMKNHVDACPDCISQSVFNRDGVIASYGIPISADIMLAHSKHIAMAYNGLTTISSPFSCADTGDFIMNIYTPLGSDRILAMAVPGLMFTDLLSGYRLWQTGNIYMIDGEGTIIADREKELVLHQRNYIKYVEENPGSASEEERGIGEFMREALSNEKGAGAYRYEGNERLCFYKRITGSLLGWRVVVAAPLHESPKAGVQHGLLFAALFFLGVGVLASIVLSEFIARPFTTLQKLNETVKTQNERAKILLDAMPLACRLWNNNFEIFAFNEESLRLFQLKDGQDFMNRYFDCHPEYQPDGKASKEQSAEYLKKAFEEGRYVYEWMHRTSDGTLIPTETTLVRVPYGDGFAVAGYTRDLREHKKMMKEIEQRDTLLRTGHQTAKILLAGDGENIEASLISSMEVVGRSADVDRVHIWRSESLDGEHCFIHAYEWLSDVGRECAAPIALKIPYRNIPEWVNMFLRGEYINGPLSERPREDQALLKAYDIQTIVMIPLFLQEEFWGLFTLDDCRRERTFTEDEISILRSVSLLLINAVNRSAQAEKIREAHERANLLLNTTPLGVTLWNTDYSMFDCNEELVRLFGAKSNKDCCERFYDFSPEYQPDGQLSREKAIKCIKKAFDEGKHVFEWMHQIQDGTPLPTEVTLVRVEYEKGYAVAAYIRDLREYKKMMLEIKQRDNLIEDALEAAQKASRAKSDFLAKMSHEMRTPLNAVIGLSELSLENNGVDEETQSNLEKIYSAGSTLLSTVNDILDISKIEAGMLELVEVEYDVPSLINDAVTQNILRIGEKPIEFTLEISEGMFTRLYGDELRVKQIMNNLLSNAIKYTKEGTVKLAMRCVRENDMVWLTIKVLDTGRGIRSEDINRMFSNYTQLDLSFNRTIEGTGLGLPITKKLAEMMAGSVTIVSEYGKGSVFVVRIQQKFATASTISPEIVENLKNFRYSDGKRDRNLRRKRISLPYARVLVVDDNATNLDVAKGLLKPYKMHIDCVNGGQKAVDAIRAEEVTYHAVFMDHMMPDMDGIEAIRAIRDIGTDYAKNIPVIALTANALAGNEEMFLHKGFQAFLSKPIDISRLDEVIRRWVRNKEMDGQLLPYLQQDRRKTASRRSRIDRRKLNTDFAGLDINKGMAHFGGDKETYLQILRSYAMNTRPLLESIEHVSEDGLADYAVTVHGIKGSSRGIFADMLGDSAEGLEHAATAGDFKYVDKHNPTFLDAAWKLVHDIEDMFSMMNTENTKPKKDKPDGETLSKILTACKVYDMDGVEAAMAEIDRYQYQADGGLVDWLRENVKLTNFKQITEKLSEI